MWIQNYLTSYVETFRSSPMRVLPDSDALTIDQPFIQAMRRLVIRAGHKRGVPVTSSETVQVPIMTDMDSHLQLIDHIHQRKIREINDGFHGALIYYPELVGPVNDVFFQRLANQTVTNEWHDNVEVSDEDLLETPRGPRTFDSLGRDIRIALSCLVAWLNGSGRIVIDNLVEDLASARFACVRLWQCVRYRIKLDNGYRKVTETLFSDELGRQIDQLTKTEHDLVTNRYREAANILSDFVTNPQLTDPLKCIPHESLQVSEES